MIHHMFSWLVSDDFSVTELLTVCSLARGGASSLILIALNSLVVSAGAGEPSSLAGVYALSIHAAGHCGQTPRFNFPVGNLSPKRKRAELKGWISQGIHFYF